MYKSPIELICADIEHQIVKQQDEEVYKAVLHFIPNIDKEELIRALQYDREQYEKGYMDGSASAQKWIPVTEHLPTESDGTVLVCHADKPPYYLSEPYINAKHNRRVVIGHYSEHSKRWYGEAGSLMNDITHWMPRPEPPKE